MRKKLAVIGSGISGLSAAHFLRDHFDVVVYESSSRPGGLIQCDLVEGVLYHKVGGHVFNSKINEVLGWFWDFFDRDKEFFQAERNACIALDKSTMVGYPIENHLHQLPPSLTRKVVTELLELYKKHPPTPCNFDEFLRNKFGSTLYELYFKPYNEKIWQCDLAEVALSWLEGKLPMPKIEEIILSNIFSETESNMVHSSFYYPKERGSQFIADRLAEGLDLRLMNPVHEIRKDDNCLSVNGQANFDAVLYTGNIKRLGQILEKSLLGQGELETIRQLGGHGTTTVLCELEENPYTWIYLPSKSYRSHRIICTGNFAPSNNRFGRMSGTVEFTGYLERPEIEQTLLKLPYNPKYLAHHYEEFTYPIQFEGTRGIVCQVKEALKKSGIYLTGRFAEWEYYNMDTAIAASMRVVDEITKDLSV